VFLSSSLKPQTQKKEDKMKLRQLFGLLFSLLLISLVATSCAVMPQGLQARNVKISQDSIDQVGFFAIFIDDHVNHNNLIEVEAMVMNKDRAIKKAEIYEKIQQEKERLDREFPRPNNDNVAEIEEYQMKMKKELVFTQKLLAEFFEVRGPLVSFYVSPSDLGGLDENRAFEMRYVPCEKIESGPLSVERFSFYHIKVL